MEKKPYEAPVLVVAMCQLYSLLASASQQTSSVTRTNVKPTTKKFLGITEGGVTDFSAEKWVD